MRIVQVFILCLLTALPVAAQDAPAEEEGGGFLERFLEDKLSGAGREVTVTGFEGALSSRATLEALTIADADGAWLRLDGVVLDWSRAALLRGRLEVAELSAEEIQLIRLPKGESQTVERSEARPFALPDLPVAIQIGRIATERLVLGEPVLGQAAILAIDGTLGLADGAGAAQLAAERRDAEGRFVLSAGFSNESRELTLDLQLAEAAGGLLSSRLGLPGAPPLDLTLDGAGPLDDFAAAMTLATADTPRLSGDFTLAAPPDAPEARRFALSVSGDLSALVVERLRPFFGADSVLELSGTRTGDGAVTVDQFALATQALNVGGTVELAAGGLPQRIALDGRLDGPVALPLSGPETRVDGATLRARFDAAAGERWTAQLGLEGLARDGLTLGAVQLDGTGSIRADAISGELVLSGEGLGHADPDLARAMGTTVRGMARLRWAEGTAPRLEALTLVSGDARLEAQGVLGTAEAGLPIDGSARLSLGDLTRFAPLAERPLGGAAEARVEGRYVALGGAFDLSLSADTRDLQTGTPQLDPLLAGQGTLRLAAVRDTEGTRLNGLDIETPGIALQVQGDLSTASGGLVVSARAPDLAPVAPGLDGPATLQAEMGWQAGGVLRLDRFEAALAGASLTATGTLAPEDPALPVDLEVVLDAPRLAAFAGLAGRGLGGAVEARLQAEGALRGDGDVALTLRAEARDLELGLGAADSLWRGQSRIAFAGGRRDGGLMLDSLVLESAGLRARAASGREAGVVDLSARLADLATLVPGLPGALTLDGTIAPKGDTIRVDLDAQGLGGITATARGTVARDARTANVDLAGSAPLALANAAIAPRSLDGLARFDLSVNGPPGLSALSGQIAISGARLALPDMATTLTNLQGQVGLAGGRAQLDFSGDLGGGRVALDGSLGLSAPFPGDLAITLERAELRDPGLYDTRLDGRVTVNGALTDGATIGGQIILGRTEVTVPSGGLGGAGPIPEIVHLGASGLVRDTRVRAGLTGSAAASGSGVSRPYPLALVIEAPGGIFVRGRGLDAELGGHLQLGGTTADVVPLGRFELVRGRLDILTRRFALTEGRIDLQGALDPYLYFVASNQGAEVTSQVILEGLASAPEIRFASDPELPEEEVLAQILFGQGLENLSAFQAAELAAAVATLAGRGGGGLLSRLREGAGLDDLDVTRTATGGTELRFGKYLSDNIYSEVAVDDEGRSAIELNLDVSPQVTVRGSLGAEGETGIGVFYERDY